MSQVPLYRVKYHLYMFLSIEKRLGRKSGAKLNHRYILWCFLAEGDTKGQLGFRSNPTG